MKLVVDTNVLLSALIADSVTRTLLGAVDDPLVTPVGLKRELCRHGELVREKSGLSETELEELTNRLLGHVEFVPDSELEAFREEAAEELADVDPDDVIFLAAALAVDGGIWSDDRHLREQDLVPVVTTEDVFRAFEAEPKE